MDAEKIAWKLEDIEKVAGVVQNPQPAIMTATLDVDAATTTRMTELVTEMGAPEYMKLYTIMAYILPVGTPITVNDSINDNGAIPQGTAAWTSGFTDMDLSIFVGNNRVPHRPIDLAVIDANDRHEIVLPTPIFIEWSNRLYVQVQNNDPTAPPSAGAVGPPIVPGTISRVKLSLVGEIVDENELRRRLERQAKPTGQ